MQRPNIKKTILIITLAIFVGIFLSAGVADAGKNKNAKSVTKANVIEVTVDFPEPVITKVDGYDRVTMDGAPSFGNTGEPVLPVTGFNVLIPAGKEIKNSEVILGEKVTLPGTYNVEPAQKPIPLSYEGPVEKTLPNDEIYKSRNLFPKERRKEVTTQKMSGYEIAVFNLSPVEYIPLDGKLSYYKTITLRVNLESKKKAAVGKKAAEEPGKIARQDVKLRKSPKDKKRLERLTVNPQDISGYDALPEDAVIAPLSGDSAASGILPMAGGSGGVQLLFLNPASYQYVVITNENLKNAPGNPPGQNTLQTLCAEKQARGITTRIVTVDGDADGNGVPDGGIYANYSGTRPDGGTDNATRIRNFIIDAHNNWETEYILLAGSAGGNPSHTEVIPLRILQNYFGSIGGIQRENEIPSDLYYGCLDGTMDSNHNGIYGENDDGTDKGYGDSQIDLVAEVYIGRALVSTQTELSNFVRKTLAYKNSKSTYPEYLYNIYMVGEHLGFGGVSEYATESMEEIRLGSSAHGYTTTGFASMQQLELNTLYDTPQGSWSSADLIGIINNANNGVHVLNHLGHTFYDYLMRLSHSTYAPGRGVPNIDTALTNTEYFFAYSQGCWPGAFDFDSMAEHLIKNQAGAFAAILNGRYGWGRRSSTAGPSQYFNREFWDAIFGEFILNLGKANQDSKEDNLWNITYECHDWVYRETNLFGDPELEFIIPPANGSVWFDRDYYTIPSTVEISVDDFDLNTNKNAQEQVVVYVTSQRETTAETVTLTEVNVNSRLFKGTIQLQAGTPVHGDGAIQVNSATDTITVTYNEQNPSGTKTDTAEADGVPPSLTSTPSASQLPIAIDDQTVSVTITWQTQEPTISTIHYGKTSPSTAVVVSSAYVTNHSITLTGLDPDVPYYYTIDIQDRAGNITYYNNGGSNYQFTIKAPNIEITPSPFSINTYEGATEPIIQTLTISNTAGPGSYQLLYDFSYTPKDWLIDVSPTGSGSIPQGGAPVNVQIKLNPKILKAGTYTTQITIHHNSPAENPTVIPIMVNAIAAPAIHYKQFHIVDDWTGRSYLVNGDGNFNQGEQIELRIEMENFGSLPSNNTTATLSIIGTDPYVTILDGTASWGNIAAGATVTSGTDENQTFFIKASEDIPDHHITTFGLAITNGTLTWYDEFELESIHWSDISVGNDIRVDRDNPTFGHSEKPQMASDNNGGVYAVWQDQRGAYYDIYFNYSRDFGVTWQEYDIRLDRGSPAGAKDSLNPQIAVDNNGHIYVVWEDKRNGSYKDIYFNYSSDFGVTWQANDIRLDSGTAGAKDSRNPQIAVDNNGNVYVVWEDKRVGSHYDIYFNYSGDSGATWQVSDIRLDKDTAGATDSYSPQIAADNNGHVYVVWEDWRDIEDSTSNIYFNCSNNFGASWQAADVRLSPPLELYLYRAAADPQIAADNNGNVYVVWGEERNSPYYSDICGIYFNYSNDFGSSWQANDTRLNTNNPPPYRMSINPHIAADHKGHVYVAWQDYRNGTGTYSDIYFNYSHNFGTTWRASDIRLDAGTAGAAHSLNPQISANNNGNMYVVWEDWRNGNKDIYLNYSRDFGATWFKDYGENADMRIDSDAPGAAASANPQVILDNSGDIYVLWQDERSVYKKDIYFNRVTTAPRPRFTSDNWTAEEGGVLAVPVTAKSPEGTQVELFWDVRELSSNKQNKISNATFPASFKESTGETIGTFNWTPPASSSGEYHPVMFIMRDELGRCGYNDIGITVGPSSSPALAPIGNKLVNIGSPLSFTVSATDPNGNAMSFTHPQAGELPTGASFNVTLSQPGNISGTFNWTPNSGQVGAHPVLFEVSDGSLRDSETITIAVSLAADFTADKTEGKSPVTVQFTDQSLGSITSRSWDFGDPASGANNTSTLQNPSHTYNTASIYTVSLTVTNASGSDVKTKTDYITVSSPPTADFGALPVAGSKPLIVQFIDLSVGTITGRLWNFGDPASGANNTSTLQNPSHTYNTAGTYTVSLTVTGASGSDMKTREDYITASPPVPAVPVADFGADQREARTPPLTVHFTDMSSGSITWWTWDFGDGEMSFTQSPTHVYDQAGIYTVQLTVTGPGGTDIETKTDYIAISVPLADFTADPTTGGSPLIVHFTDSSAGVITWWLWDFGDGATSTEQNPSHTYNTEGTYTVSLSVAGYGGADVTTRYDYIVVSNPGPPRPNADFAANTTMGSTPLTVNFTDASLGLITSRSWNFGDGETSTDKNPSHTYTTSGIYTVSLTATGDTGNDTEIKSDYITAADKVVSPGGSIQDAINTAAADDIIYINAGTYDTGAAGITADGKNLIITGKSASETVIKGNFIFKNSDSTIKDIAVLYKEGPVTKFTSAPYNDFGLLCDAGITAINSDVTVRNCAIRPDPDAFSRNNCGKGVQIWNLYGNRSISPVIQNNLITNTDTGVYLFAQAFGGSILGEIKNNTLDLNTYGIVMRMHRENLSVEYNIITRSADAIHLTYDSFLSERSNNIRNNCFGRLSFGNTHDAWCDKLQEERLALPDGAGNITKNPGYIDPENLDYYPQDPSCANKGYRPQ